MAAVLGREFDRDLMVALWPSDGPELEPAMAQLAVQDVLRPIAGERARYEFSHALLQEAANRDSNLAWVSRVWLILPKNER